MGKSTLIRTGGVSCGRFDHADGADVTALPAHRRAARGSPPWYRGGIFPAHGAENLKNGPHRRAAQPGHRQVLGYFPRLRERLSQLAGTMSGGEQQMLAISRGIMTIRR
jgi:branched-chain amino acid transport system ATP-binding protein